MVSLHENTITRYILDCAFQVHSSLGPGLLERIYEKALQIELRKKGLLTRTQVGMPVWYDDEDLGIGYRADIIVENKVIVEIKSVSGLDDVHKKTLLTYLRLSGLSVGLLLNFNKVRLKEGICRIVNNL